MNRLKKILILTGLLLIPWLGHSQSSSDTIVRIHIRDAKRVYAAARQKQAADSLAALLQQDVFNLSNQLDECAGALRYCQKGDSVNTGMGATIGKIDRVQADQRRALEGEVQRLTRQVRKERRRTRATAIAGLLLAAGTGIFILK